MRYNILDNSENSQASYIAPKPDSSRSDRSSEATVYILAQKLCIYI